MIEFEAAVAWAGREHPDQMVFEEDALRRFAEENWRNFTFKDGKLFYRNRLPEDVYDRLLETARETGSAEVWKAEEDGWQ